jgi:hypothetical protein
METIISFFLGIIGGLMTNQISGWLKRNKIKSADRRSRKHLFNYNPEDDHLFMINRWSVERPLEPSNHKVLISYDQPPQDFISKDVFQKYVDEQLNEKRTGDICYLVDYQIDHHESIHGKQFTITVAPCDYSEHMASYQYLSDHPELQARIKNLLHQDIKLYLKNPIPADMAVNVVVLSESNFLAIKRSKSVDSARNLWTVGPFETMILKKDFTPGGHEDLFSLSRRCLKEELNLDDNHYGKIVVSWFGLLLTSVRAHIVTVVKIKGISEGDVIQLAHNAHSNFESDGFEWVPLKPKDIKEYIENNQGNVADRNWISFSKLSLSEALRVRAIL